MDIPVYYIAPEDNLQLPNGLPGLVGELNKLDIATFIDAPNAALVRQGISALGPDKLRGMGLILPVMVGQGFEVAFLVRGGDYTEGGEVEIPLDAVLEPLGVDRFSVDMLVPMGEVPVNFAATFTLSARDADGNDITDDAPDPIAYDPGDYTASDPIVSTWCNFDVSEAKTLVLTISDVTGGDEDYDSVIPLMVKARINSNIWNH